MSRLVIIVVIFLEREMVNLIKIIYENNPEYSVFL